MTRRYDFVVAGSCVVDLVCRPIDLHEPISRRVLHPTEPVVLTGGGITINCGVTMARLGAQVGVLSYLGDDAWAPVVRNLLQSEGVDDTLLEKHPSEPTSTTVVAVDPSGERCFFHCVGAPEHMDAAHVLGHLDVLARTGTFILGYYSLMPRLEDDLPDVFAQIRTAGCRTALDAAGTGGAMSPLDRILPELDVYVPSQVEAQHQTGFDDPERIIRAYRACGAPGLLGVKLGMDGVLLSPNADEFVHVDVVAAPGPVVDTTGAGDNFYAGLLVGLHRGLDAAQAGKLGAAAAACCVTSVGGATGGRNLEETIALAGVG